MPDSIGVEWLFLISLVAGFIGAMSGMGGGVVLIPALTLFRLDIKEAIALSMVSVIATSSGAASAYVRDRITNLKVGMFLEMFTICGALVGAGLSLATAQRWLFILFGLVLLASWLAMYLQQHFHGGPRSPQDAFSRWLELKGSYHDQASGETIHYQGRRLPGRPHDVRSRPGCRDAGPGSRRPQGHDLRPGHGTAVQGVHHHQ